MEKIYITLGEEGRFIAAYKTKEMADAAVASAEAAAEEYDRRYRSCGDTGRGSCSKPLGCCQHLAANGRYYESEKCAAAATRLHEFLHSEEARKLSRKITGEEVVREVIVKE